MTKPSQQALDLAVKPAGMTWGQFAKDYDQRENTYVIALAFAEHLDKADKVGRMVADLVEAYPEGLPVFYAKRSLEAARELILPDPIDPDLLEAREMVAKYYEGRAGPAAARRTREGDYDGSAFLVLALAALKRGRELAKEQDRG